MGSLLMEDIRLIESCGWEDTKNTITRETCVYTHELSLDLAVPERPVVNSF